MPNKILFQTYGAATPLPAEDILEPFDFILYERVREVRAEGVPIHLLDAKLIYRDEDSHASTKISKRGKPSPPDRQFIGSPEWTIKPGEEFVADHEVRGYPCSAKACKPLNDAEHLRLTHLASDAENNNAGKAVAYYNEVKALFGEWYHVHGFSLPSTLNQRSQSADAESNYEKLLRKYLEQLSFRSRSKLEQRLRCVWRIMGVGRPPDFTARKVLSRKIALQEHYDKTEKFDFYSIEEEKRRTNSVDHFIFDHLTKSGIGSLTTASEFVELAKAVHKLMEKGVIGRV